MERMLFPFDEVMELIEFNQAYRQASPSARLDKEGDEKEQGEARALHLVGDHGVYLMSGTVEKMPPQEGAGEPVHVLYAKGCNPHEDEDFYECKCALFGGDDGVEPIPVEHLNKLYLAVLKHKVTPADVFLTIRLLANEVEVGLMPRR